MSSKGQGRASPIETKSFSILSSTGSHEFTSQDEALRFAEMLRDFHEEFIFIERNYQGDIVNIREVR